ncbi:MAG: TRAP transporter small permease subunit [Pseudomonadota bacterium]
MPSIDFVLPHWAYWLSVLIFPAIAMVLSRRLGAAEKPSLTLAYFLWLVAGYIGLHRLYLKNLWGLGFIVLFGALLYASGQKENTRDELSAATAAVVSAENRIARATRDIDKSERDIARFTEELRTLEEGSTRKRITEGRLERAQARLESSRETITENEETLIAARPAEIEARERREWYVTFGAVLFYGLLALMLIDAILLPFLLYPAGRRRIEAAAEQAEPSDSESTATPADMRFASPRGFTGWVDRNSLWFGEFVAYWTVLAVMAFLYEVLARKVINSPTIWVHEGVYYLFGMQYMIAGCYAMLTESHVRVDIFYARFSPRLKAAVDLATSVFFFIFVFALLLWGWVFAMQSIGNGNTVLSAWARGDVETMQLLAEISIMDFLSDEKRNGEYSFNNPWQIPLWPVKLMIVMGAALLLLQGISRIIKDLHTLRFGEPLHKVEG